MTIVLWMTLTCILIDPNSSMYSIERGIPIVKNLFSFDLHFLFFLFLFLHVVDIIHKPLISTNCTPLLTNQISETNNQDFLYENYGLETIVSLKKYSLLWPKLSLSIKSYLEVTEFKNPKGIQNGFITSYLSFYIPQHTRSLTAIL